MVIYTAKHKIPFVIDDDDWEIVSQYLWHVDNRGYVRAYKRGRLHQFLNGQAPVGFEWDHENRNKLDNRRQNVRLVTQLVNRQNRGIFHANTSGVTGVKKSGTGWRAQIGDGAGKQISIGWFENFDEAVKARQEYESIVHGARNSPESHD